MGLQSVRCVTHTFFCFSIIVSSVTYGLLVVTTERCPLSLLKCTFQCKAEHQAVLWTLRICCEQENIVQLRCYQWKQWPIRTKVVLIREQNKVCMRNAYGSYLYSICKTCMAVLSLSMLQWIVYTFKKIIASLVHLFFFCQTILIFPSIFSVYTKWYMFWDVIVSIAIV